MKVAKFGGSSVANATQIKKVCDIIKSDDSRKFVVVSAPGKRNKEDIKVTDLLIELGDTYASGKAYESVFEKIVKRYADIIEELDLPKSLLDEITDSTKKTLESDEPDEIKFDAVKASGEDSSARIVSAYLNKIGIQATYINPKEAGMIVSNQPGNAQILPESFPEINKLRDREGVLVIPGFFGYTANDKLMTFSRGGSDITGSIIAAGVKAELYENFTDVDSVFSVNPNIVENPKEITVLTYKEMRELSYAGFSVFHDEALIPAFQEKIPVCIKNTNNPSAPGTMIVAEKEQNGNCVVGIASDTDFCSLYVEKYLMNREVGFGRKLLQILEDEHVSFEHVPSGIDDMSVIIRNSEFTPEKETRVVERIQQELQVNTLKIRRNLAMIMVVGEGMKSTIGIISKATNAFAEANVNIEMVNQGSSEVSIMFGIEEEGLERSIRSLYKAFFG
ncbi:aspartate kinase [Aciduricibacillus chroicocephali]|uniref:Aspartokinase n=1 Tax=Aciduricibacillus chroicocephali TaxID=3054939 RepID=A0ABY9KS37_9BACI|nr:aspartate kinase [Bacillaceae bacterium 44XB]